MTITPYHVDNVLSAYTRQNKMKVSNATPRENVPEGKHSDVVTLSVKEENKAEQFEKISYSLRDVILGDNE